MGSGTALVDSHCHLDAGEFDADRAAVLQRAREAGVRRQVIPAITADEWPKLRDVCSADEDLFPAYGLHPMFLADHRQVELACEPQLGFEVGGLLRRVQVVDKVIEAAFADRDRTFALQPPP